MTAETIKQRANPNKMHRGSLYIPTLLYEKLRLHSFVSRKSQSKIIEEAISEYLDRAMASEELNNVTIMHRKGD